MMPTVDEASLPEETRIAMKALREELERQDQAGRLDVSKDVAEYRPRYAAPARQEELEPKPGKKLESLEDLYAIYPDVGNGQYKLRVERLTPKTHPASGVPVAGVLCEIHEKIDTMAFLARFGGTRYKVTVMGPGRGRQDEHGQPPIRSLASAELFLPGSPKLDQLPVSEEEFDLMNRMMPGTPGRTGAMWGAEHPDVTMKRLELEAQERNRERDEKAKLQEAAQQASRAPDALVVQVRSAYEAQITGLREQLLQQLQLVKERDEELNRLRERMVQVSNDAQNQIRTAEVELTNKLKAQYEQEAVRITSEHARTLERTGQEHRDQIERMRQEQRDALAEGSRRYNDDRGKYESDAQRERDRYVRDATDREKALKDDIERRERIQKETHDARITDLQRTHDRELQSLRDTMNGQIMTIKESVENRALIAENTAKMQIDNNKEQLERYRSENRSLRTEIEELRRSSIKDPITFLRETKEVASSMLGMVDASEVKGGEEETDWKKMAVSGLLGAVKNIPDAIEKVGALRQQSQQAAMQQAAMQQQAAMRAHQMRQQGASVPRALQAAPGQPQQAAPSIMARRQVRQGPGIMQAPPQAWAAVPSPPDAPPVGPPPPTGPILQNPVSIAPAQPTVPTETYQAQPQQAAAAQAAPAPAEGSQPAAPAGPPPGAVAITEEQLGMFMKELEEAIEGEIITPEMFAGGLIERLGPQGPEICRQFLGQVSADQIFQFVERGGKVSRETRDGQKWRAYIQGVWTETAKLVKA